MLQGALGPSVEKNKRLYALCPLTGLDISLENETTLSNYCLLGRLPEKVREGIIVYKMIVSVYSVSFKQMISFFITSLP